MAAAAFALPAASSPAALYQIFTGTGAYIFSDVTTSSNVLATLPDGTVINVVCQTRGEVVERTTLWDFIDSPVVGWVPDKFTTTPNLDTPSPGLPPC